MALQGYRPRFVILDEIAAFAAASEEKTYRGMDGNDQLVEIDHKWGYAWSGDPLLIVGDYVVLPTAATTRLRRGATPWWVGQVTDMGSSWTGQHTRIIRLATEDDLRKWAEIQEAKRMALPMRERYRPRGS